MSNSSEIKKQSDKFRSILWHSCKDTYAPVSGGLSILIALISYIFIPDKAIPLKVLLPILVVAISILSVFIHAALTAHNKYIAEKESMSFLPSVNQAINPPPHYNDYSVIIILNPTPLLGQDSMVSIYYDRDGCEIYMCLGHVCTIQDNGFIQIGLELDIPEAHTETLKKITDNNTSELQKIKVKPFIPKFALAQNYGT